MTSNIFKLALISCIAVGIASCQKDITDRFADANFKKAVYVVLGKNPGAPIYDSDVKKIKSLILPENEEESGDQVKGIASLAGIEYFTALDTLVCSNNNLNILDISKNTKLRVLICYENKLTALDVSKNVALTALGCGYNQLIALDISKNTKLKMLGCDGNQLAALDVSKNVALTALECERNQLTALDISKNTKLKMLGCDGNQLAALDVSKNIIMDTLWCRENQLTTLDVSKNPRLTFLNCRGNQLTSLDVSKNTKLTVLGCAHNFMADQSAVTGFSGKWDDANFVFSPQRTPPLTDARDGKIYKTVKIGDKVWMGENLNYKTSKGSWCYGYDDANCNKYGRLYDWNTAKISCPAGWHLPLRAEWDNLMRVVGSKKKKYVGEVLRFDYWEDAGKKLKSISGWNKRDNGSSGNGTDAYGFSALPGGLYNGGSFNLVGDDGYLWTATGYSDGYAYFQYILYNFDFIIDGYRDKSDGVSVRCARD